MAGRPVLPHVEDAKKQHWATGQSLHLLWMRAFKFDEQLDAANALVAQQAAAIADNQAATDAALRKLETQTPTTLPVLPSAAPPGGGGDPPPDPGTVPDLFNDVVAARAAYGATMTNVECVALINTVAWNNASDGFGLMAKTGGNHGPQPHTGTLVSVDLIFHQPTNTLWDALIDSGHITAGPGTAKPQWSLNSTNPSGAFVPPVAP